MQWQDKGIVLSSKKHGERALILKFLTNHNGVYSGVVRYGTSKKIRYMFEPGNLLSLTWRARLPEQMGSFQCDALELYTSKIINKPLHLAALCSHTSLLDLLLPERENCSNIFTSSMDLIEQLSSKSKLWMYDYIRWEIYFLSELGFGLDLKKCAVTGKKESLTYVSPKTGRAISREAAGKWANRLLPLPPFIINDYYDAELFGKNLQEGIKLSSYFLNKYSESIGLKLPYARNAFVKKISK